MGIKGSKMSSESIISAELLLEKFAPLSGISSKKMFGGHGIFKDGKMFALVNAKGIPHLKVNDSNREEFEAAGSVSLGKMHYSSIPQDVLNDLDLLLLWAQKSIDISKAK